MSNKNKNRRREDTESQLVGPAVEPTNEEDIQEPEVPTGEAADPEVPETDCEGCGCPDGSCENPPIDLPLDLPGADPVVVPQVYPEDRGTYVLANGQRARVRTVRGRGPEQTVVRFALEGGPVRGNVDLPLQLWFLLRPECVDSVAQREAVAAAEQYRRQLEAVAAVNAAAAQGGELAQEA